MLEAVRRSYDYAMQWMGEGQLASYIPRLSEADPNKLAVAVTGLDGNVYKTGDTRQRFTIQSIVKIVLLALALRDAGFDEVFRRVGMEPTGDPFNSITRLETVSLNKPLNPMINAGAIAVTACIPGHTAAERFDAILTYARELLGNPGITWDEETFASEMCFGDRNRALGYMLRSMGVVAGDVERHLEIYFRSCSIYVNCEEISFLGAVLAGGGVSPATGRRLMEPFHARAICSLLTTCGMYDASGEFALRVGFPAKSGVGGGIAAAVPGRMGIGVYSPALDGKGNSCCGIKALECLSHELNLSIFDGGRHGDI